MKKLMVVLACGLLAMSGCGPGEKKAKTPKEAVEHLAAAMDEGDADAFAACFHAKPEDKPVVRAMGDFTISLMEFQKEVIDAYGEASQGSTRAGGPVQVPQPFMNMRSQLEQLEIKNEGDTATAVAPDGKGDPLTLRKVGGRWLIDLGDKLAGGKDREQMLKMMPKMTEAINSVREKIGKPGMTAEKVNQELGAAIMKTMVEAMGDATKGTRERP
jgi:hypothetical protein